MRGVSGIEGILFVLQLDCYVTVKQLELPLFQLSSQTRMMDSSLLTDRGLRGLKSDVHEGFLRAVKFHWKLTDHAGKAHLDLSSSCRIAVRLMGPYVNMAQSCLQETIRAYEIKDYK